MKALVYHGPGKKALEDRPKPGIIDPSDAIVRITKTTICGTDLHILKGDVPTCTPGRILGHEGVGVVESVGAGVTMFKPGDHVLVSCILRAVNAITAAAGCIRIARPGAGSSATRSMARKRSSFASSMPIQASIRYPRALMTRRSSC